MLALAKTLMARTIRVRFCQKTNVSIRYGLPRAFQTRPSVHTSLSCQLERPSGHRRALHEQHGLTSNRNRRLAEQSRGRLISRLDRILASPNAEQRLSTDQLAHVQYLRDFWAEPDYHRAGTHSGVQQMNVMTHETQEILRRYSAPVEKGHALETPRTGIAIPQESPHWQYLRRVEDTFGEHARVLAQHAWLSRRQLTVWTLAALLAVPVMFLFERLLTWSFPERARTLEENEKRKYVEARELLLSNLRMP